MIQEARGCRASAGGMGALLSVTKPAEASSETKG